MPQDAPDILENADIIIIPDNDAVGKTYSEEVANYLSKSNIIKILDLTKEWPSLKEKGDITDVFEMVNNDEDVLIKLEKLEKETNIYNKDIKLKKAKIKKWEKEEHEELQVYKEKISIGNEEININLKVPYNYSIKDGKILQRIRSGKKYKWVGFSNSLVLIKSILENIDTGEQKLELIYYKPNKKEWKILKVDKNIINNKHSILTLGNKGIPVTSNNSPSWIGFLTELEQENYDNIPTIRTVDRLGWIDNNIFIPYVNEDVKLEAEENATSWLEGFKSKGTLEKWIKVMKPLRENDIFRCVLASGFVPPLLKYIGARTFIVNIWGSSKSGKSASLYASLSAWR